MLIYEAKWDQAARDAYLKSHPQNFAGPGGSYPIRDASDVGDAWDLAGHAADPAAVRAKIKEIAARMGFSHALPDTAKAESANTFDLGVIAVSNGAQIFLESVKGRPQKKIGTLPICWLEYNARSLNGRIYPKATCDAIYRAAQQVLSDPDALPPTTFISHEAANGNVNTDLIGAPVKVWQEGNKFWAHIDIADTSVAHDILGLVEGGYLKSGSMRVAGVELLHDRNYDLPLVVVQEGIAVQFLGIDLTTRPGLSIARIPQVLYESNGQEAYNDAFTFECLSIEGREEPPAMTIPIFIQVALGMLQEGVTPDRAAHQRIHDHLAGVMDSAVKECHGGESARFKALIEGQLDEAGRVIANKHAVAIAAAHDEAAKACGMTCEGCYKDALGMAPSDTDNDGDNPAAGFDPDHDGESQRTPPALTESHKEDKPLTHEEMIAALAAKGFKIEAPKTTEDEIAELKRLVAEQSAQLKTLTETAPQRQTLANQSQFEESSTLQEEVLYEEGDYLKADLAPKNWRALSNRRVPWPKDLDPKLALHEMAPFLAHSLNAQEAQARGRSIDAFIAPNEIM